MGNWPIALATALGTTKLAPKYSRFQACHRDNPHFASLGAELYDLTATQDSYLVPEEANSVYAALFRRDMRDYYRRLGWSIYAVQNLAGVVQLTGRLAHDRILQLGKRSPLDLAGQPLGPRSVSAPIRR